MNARMTFLGWYQFKLFIEHASGISLDALHILVGFAAFLLAAQLFRRSVTSLLPWLAILVLAVGNEAHDLMIELWPDLGSQLGEAAKDIMLTMALPTLLLLATRYRPALFGRDSAQLRSADDHMPSRAEILLTMGASAGLEDERQ
jgi:hypothetical protein